MPEPRMPKLKVRKEAARQLIELIAETGLIEEIRSDLYHDFLKTDAEEWPAIRLKLELLQTAEDILRRMES